jgi:hypothetical protein
MKLRYLYPIALLLAPGEASAAHCPHGQIYRVHMHTCVSSRSSLARIAFRHYHHVSFTELQQQEAPPTPRHRRHPRGYPEHPSCDPARMCGDDHPDDAVVETATPAPASVETATPGELPDPFGKSIMRGIPRQPWKP